MIELVLRSLFKRPATTHYPFETFTMPPRFRGRPVVHSENCIGCRLCVRNCPSGAIEITKVGEREFEASIDLGKCVYCGQCADSCPKRTIELTKDFELATLDRGTLKVVFHAERKPPTGPEENPPAQPPSG